MNNNTNTEQKNQENKCLKIRFSQAEIEGLDPRIKALTGYFDRLPNIEEIQELLGVGRAAAFKLLRPLKAIDWPKKANNSFYQINKKAFNLSTQLFVLCDYLSQLNSRYHYQDYIVYSATISKKTGIDYNHIARQLTALKKGGFLNFEQVKKGKFKLSFKDVPAPIFATQYNNIDDYLGAFYCENEAATDNRPQNPFEKIKEAKTLEELDRELSADDYFKQNIIENFKQHQKYIYSLNNKYNTGYYSNWPKYNKEQERIADTQDQSLVDNPFSKLCRTKEEKAADEQAEQERIAEIIKRKREAEQERIADTQDQDLGIDILATLAKCTAGQFELIKA